MDEAPRQAAPDREKLPRGSHGLPAEFVVRSQRERLFAGMARVMARQGYAATTVDHIAVESGVSRKALYAHFTGKEDVLLQAHRAITARIAAGTEPAIAEQPDWKGALRAFFDWMLELFAREPTFAHLAFVEMPAATPESRRLQRETLKPLRDLIERGGGEAARPIGDAAIDGLVGGLTYVVARTAEDGDAEEIRQLRPKLMAWIVLALESPRAAERELEDRAASP